MHDKIIYRHWQPGDDDAILALLMPIFKQVSDDRYRGKFDNSHLDPEAVHLALPNERVVGHVWGEPVSICIEGKIQEFGMVTLACVAPDMRRQGVATRLMQGLHAYFERKSYRGSILYTDSEIAAQVYQSLGYQEVTRELRTQVSPRQGLSPLKWTEVGLEDLDALHQLNKRWARHNFLVLWDNRNISIHRFNMQQYRVLRCGTNIIGYAKWDEPSAHRPDGLIRDPIVPDEDPMEVITSVQSAISTPRAWQTFEGSKYENSLRSLGCLLKPTTQVDMFLAFGQEIDLTGYHRTAY